MKPTAQRNSNPRELPALVFAFIVVSAALAGPLFTRSQAALNNSGPAADKPNPHQSRQSTQEGDWPALSIGDIKIMRADHSWAARANANLISISIASEGWQPGEPVEVSIYRRGAVTPDATFNLMADERGRLINTKLMLFGATTGLRYMIAVGLESEKFVAKKFDILRPSGGPFVNTYESTCTTLQTSFILGDTVCAQVTAIDTMTFTARFDWIDPDGIVQEMGPTITASGQTDTFMIPASGPNAKTGTWRVQITDVNDGSNLASQNFTVTAGGPQPEAIATFQSDCNTPESSFTGGSTVCAKVTGIDAGEENTFRIDWLRPDSSVAETGPVVTMNNQTDTFMVPSAGPDGTWTVQLTRISDGASQASANFTVTVIPCQAVLCPGNVSTSNDPGQCGAVVNYPPATPDGDCGTITCSPASGSFFPVGTTTVTCTSTAKLDCTFAVTVNDTQAPNITCPMNQSVPNDPNQCGAVVNYPPPTATDNCPMPNSPVTPVCSPASGSFFPVGTTTVTCQATDAAGNTGSCTFTVRVNDPQPPTITCPANVTSVTPTLGGSSAVVTFPPPTASDNCPGVTTACNPPSGSTFPVGCTTVTCTATDASGNTATCTFQVCVFNICLQDDSNPQNRILFNTTTGDYRFCCNGTTFTGKGKISIQGSTFTLEHNALDRRVRASATGSANAGNASLQSPPGRTRCVITDSNTSNNTNCTTCQ